MPPAARRTSSAVIVDRASEIDSLVDSPAASRHGRYCPILPAGMCPRLSAQNGSARRRSSTGIAKNSAVTGWGALIETAWPPNLPARYVPRWLGATHLEISSTRSPDCAPHATPTGSPSLRATTVNGTRSDVQASAARRLHPVGVAGTERSRGVGERGQPHLAELAPALGTDPDRCLTQRVADRATRARLHRQLPNVVGRPRPALPPASAICSTRWIRRS